MEDKRFLDLEGLEVVFEEVSELVGMPLRSLQVVDKTIKFYTTATPTEETVADFEVDIPVEYFVDQTKTTLVAEFAWSEELYPGSTDPQLEGKPVLVLAVKGDDGTVSYSFMNMISMIDVYVGKETASAKTTVNSDNTVEVEVKVSEEEGNAVEIKEDGLYVPTPEAVDISGKADKLVEDTVAADQIMVDDGTGNLKGSGKTIENVVEDTLGKMVAITPEEIRAIFQANN